MTQKNAFTCSKSSSWTVKSTPTHTHKTECIEMWVTTGSVVKVIATVSGGYLINFVRLKKCYMKRHFGEQKVGNACVPSEKSQPRFFFRIFLSFFLLRRKRGWKVTSFLSNRDGLTGERMSEWKFMRRGSRLMDCQKKKEQWTWNHADVWNVNTLCRMSFSRMCTYFYLFFLPF